MCQIIIRQIAQEGKTLKKVLVLFLASFIFFVPGILAHTGLESSIPEEGQTVNELKEVSLKFETKIEKGSSFKLSDEEGNEISLSDMQIDGDKLKGLNSEKLPNGEYTVTWKIVGADGHPIEGEFLFYVSNKDVEQKSSTPSSTEENKIEDSKDQDTNNSGNPIFSGLIIILVIIALGVIVWLVRKDKK